MQNMHVPKYFNVLELSVILIIAFQDSFAFSIRTAWVEAMEICTKSSVPYLPYTETDIMNTSINNNSWLFHATYVINKDVVNIGLKKIEDFETCAENICFERNCTFCETTRALNKSVTSIQEFITKMLPGKIYVLGSFKSQKFPSPDRCKVYRNSQQQHYVQCSELYDSNCREEVNGSKFRIILFLERKMDDTTTPFITTKEKGFPLVEASASGKSNCFLPNLFTVIGFFCIFITINVVCVSCCVNYQVKRKLRSLRIQQLNDSPCNPISEAITRMYRSINALKEEQNDTYDLTASTSVIKKSNFAINGGLNDKDNYDTGFFRLFTQSGDYDMTWSNALSSPTSPDVEYDLVQNVGAGLMTCLPEEDVYSKQRPLIREISSDLNQKCNNEHENPKELVRERTTASINGFFEVKENISRSHKLDKFQGSDKKDIVGHAEPDKGRQQKQNILYEGNSKIHRKEPCLTDEAVAENRKKTADKDVGKGLQMGEKEQDTESWKGDLKISEVDIKSKSGNNHPSSQRAGKVVDKATSLLVANMNRVMSETKL